jgi:NADPH:quinone reductase-like Zn-dependent oxidoreductase
MPEVGPNDALVKVRSAALNHLDIWVRKGIEGHPFPLPLVPCADIAGEVAVVGAEVQDWEVGQGVIVSPGVSCGACEPCLSGKQQYCRSYRILGESCDGGAAEYIAVPARNLVRKPDNLDWLEAAALSIPFLTAWTMVRRRADVQPGETVLVQAGGSGVGVAAIQMCQLLGATVIATAGSSEKIRKLEDLGADHTINYKEQDVVQEIRKVVGKKGVDVIIDHVGADTFAINQRVLSWAGRMVLCGATTGHKVDLDLRHLFFKSQSILGSTMGSMDDFIEVVDLVGKGLLGPVIDSVFPLDEIAAAQKHLEDRKAFGKVVLRVL